MLSIINEIKFNIIYKREGVAPGGLALLLVTMSLAAFSANVCQLPHINR